MRFVKERRGIVIIVAFVFLSILASVGIAFLWFSGLEKQAFENFISAVKVKFVSQSGAEYAVAELSDLAQKRAHDALYEEGGKKSIWSYPLEAYEDSNYNGKYDKGEDVFDDRDSNKYYGVPRLTAISEPSFSSDKTMVIGNKIIGYSNKKLSQIDESIYSVYSLKVRDAHSMIYINGPLVATDSGYDLAPYLVNMLNQLGELVVYSDGTTFNQKAEQLKKIPRLGDRIQLIIRLSLQRAKESGQSNEYIAPIPNKFMLVDKSFLSDDKVRFEKEEYELIKEYITTYGWVDPAVINPESFGPFVDFYGSGTQAPYTMLKSAQKGGTSVKSPQTPSPTRQGSLLPIRKSGQWQVSGSLLSLFGMCPPLIRGVRCNEPNRRGTPSPIKSKEGKQKESTTDIMLDTFGSEDNEEPLVKKGRYEQPEFPDYFTYLQERAPININTAPREILIVNLYNLKGWYFDTSPTNKTYVNPGKYTETMPISFDKAVTLADHIIAYRRKQPFTNWNQFERFLNGQEGEDKFDIKYLELVKSRASIKMGFLDKYQKMVIFANVNPNTRMGDFNPDATYGAFFTDYVDKSKLLTHTTEFTFSSMGYYEIESLGFIVKSLGELPEQGGATSVRLLAKHSLTYDVKIFDVFRHTTQRDFAKESVQWIDGKKVLVKSKSETQYVSSYPENLNNLGKIEQMEGGVRVAIPDNVPAMYDGYLSIAPKVEERSRYELFSFYNSFTKSFQPEVAAYKGDVRGLADERKSIIDTYKGKGIFPPSRLSVPGYNVSIAHLTRSSLYVDGYFAHETLRYPYEYSGKSNPNYMYGWSTKGQRRVIDEYLGYPAGRGKEETGVWNIGKTGAIEFWFKPTWNLEEQDNSDRDSRTFFSVGDAEGVREEITIETMQVASGGQPRGLHSCEKWEADTPTLIYVEKFANDVGFGDPVVVSAMQRAYGVARMVGEEILFPKPDEWGKWLALKAYVEQRKSGGFSPSYAERRSREAANRLNEIMYYESEEVRQEYEERYKKIVNFSFPEERLVIFARSQKVATFVGNNYAEESGIDDFGNFKTAAVRLLKDEWRKGTWHHILMIWAPSGQEEDDEVKVTLYVDGKPSSNPYISSPLLRNEINTLFFGVNRFKKNVSNGFPLTADGTLSDFKIYKNANDALVNLKKDRYWGRREGKTGIYWGATIAQFPESKFGRLGTISWTERIPKIAGDTSAGGDVLFKVFVMDEKGNEDKDYIFPGQDSNVYIAENGRDRCECLREDGKPVNHPDPRFCPSQNGGGFPFMHLNSLYKAKESKEKKKWSAVRYHAYIVSPRTSRIITTPILEDVTITFIPNPKILKVHELENEIK